MKPSFQVFLIAILLTAILPMQKVNGQNANSSKFYDSITYQYYSLGNWPSVIQYGKDALKNGNDYYYLRMRMGAAYYEQHNYRAAIGNYSKALSFCTSDDNARLGNYYSYLSLGNNDQASLIKSKINSETRKALAIQPNPFLDFVYFESGYSPSSGQGQTGMELLGPDSIYGEEDLQKDLFYTHFGGKIRIMPSLSVFAGFTRMNINKEKRFGYSTTDARRDSIVDFTFWKEYYYSFQKQFTDSVIPYKVSQNDFYINAAIIPAVGWKITPALHHFQVQYMKTASSFNTGTASDTAYYLASDNSWHLFDYSTITYNFQKTDTSFRNLVASLNVSKDLGNFTLEIYGSVSDFNKKRQSQLGTSLSWYPFGNTNLYTTTSAVSLTGNKKRRIIYEQSLGFKVMRNAWLTGFATLGNLDLYNEKNAYIVYNQPDPITFRCGMDLQYFFGKHIELGLMYRFYRKEFQKLTYSKAASSELGTVMVSVFSKELYSNQSIIGGLKWKF
jgi:tetratricopeptide (TPR) repeat protein